MEQIDYVQLGCSIPAIQSILEFQLTEKKNDHVYMHLTGIMGVEDDSYITDSKEKETVKVFVKESKETIFQGMIVNVEIYTYGGLRYLSVDAVSYSYLTDLKKKRRSFQDKGQTYKALTQEVIKEYNGGGVMDFCSNNKATGALIVQYDETDWEFLKRLASHFNHGLYVDAKFNTPKIYFGKKKGRNIGELTQFDYRIQKNMQEYLVQKNNTIQSLTEADVMLYQIQTKELYDIGDSVTYHGQNLFIYEKRIVVEKSILECFYTLGKENAFLCEYLYQENLAGKAIRGTVLDRVKDKVKVKLSIDQKQDEGKAWVFPYATVYAAQGHSGWYCMPEKGDTVNVYFPTKVESDAAAMESIREKPSGGDRISDPDVKYFSTPYGKEIMMTPEQIKITCYGNKDQGKCIYISLNEGDGVTISSSANVALKAEKDITIDAGGSVNIAAGEEMAIRCKTGEILMNQKVEINGDDVRIN